MEKEEEVWGEAQQRSNRHDGFRIGKASNLGAPTCAAQDKKAHRSSLVPNGQPDVVRITANAKLHQISQKEILKKRSKENHQQKDASSSHPHQIQTAESGKTARKKEMQHAYRRHAHSDVWDSGHCIPTRLAANGLYEMEEPSFFLSFPLKTSGSGTGIPKHMRRGFPGRHREHQIFKPCHPVLRRCLVE